MSEETEKKEPRRLKKSDRLVRPYSFSMEPRLYDMFGRMCEERGINRSAWLRQAMYSQMLEWREGTFDEELANEDY
jgi:hypothetical protein